MLDSIEKRREKLVAISDAIWEFAEPGFKEHKSSKAIADFLEQEGFKISLGVADMPTALVAEFGNGKPVVGFLGEYDALPRLSQKRQPVKEPLEEGQAGHGCGHNLLGVAAVGAAIALKDAIESGEGKGTVRFYGCPAEELLAGKVFMVRAGLFDDVDCALTWHPFYYNSIWAANFLAMNSAKFNFHGRTAHAAYDPYNGKSALDAVELMNVGTNYLREHIIPDARMHYVITNGGGEPNIVPAEATVWYYVRAPKRPQVEEVYNRIVDCAEGAAKMTGTTYDIEFLSGCYNVISNDVLEELLLEKFREVGVPEYTEEELRFAEELGKTAPEFLEKTRTMFREQFGENMDNKHICDTIIPVMDKGKPLPGSTDVGDVSHVVPTAQLIVTTSPLSVTTHSWQFSACTGTGIGHKGMLVAAEVLGLAGLELLKKPELVAKAKEVFEKQIKNSPYVSPLPPEAKPKA